MWRGARARVCVRVCTFARVHTHSPVQGVNKCFTRTGTHTGSLWGLGHAMSAMAMGLAIFLLKERTISSHTALGKVAFGADIAIGDVHAHAHDMMCTRTRTTCTRTDESTSLHRCDPCAGLSLVFIGGLSLREATRARAHTHTHARAHTHKFSLLVSQHAHIADLVQLEILVEAGVQA